MKKNDESSKAELRRQADERLSKQEQTPQPEGKTSARHLAHELEVHQIELEMQNEELVQARAELEAALSQYTALYDFAPVGYFTLTLGGTIRQANLAVSNLLGLKHGELIHRRLGVFVSSESLHAYNIFFEQLLSGKGKRDCELAFDKKENGRLWARLEATCFEGDDVCRVMLMDINERKQAEEIQSQLTATLAERVAELQTLMDVAPVGIAIGHDPEGRVITVNRLLSEWLNAPAGTNVSLSTPEEERHVSYQVLRNGRPARVEELPVQYAALNAKGVRNNEFSIVRSDGKTIEMLANAEPLFDDQGRVRGSIATYIDITERKRAEDDLERSKQKLNEILASIQDDFYVLDRNWNFVYASRLFTSKIGKEPKDFVGNNIWEMFPKHVGTVLEENFRAAMEKREIRRFEIGGKYTSAWYRMNAFPSADGITVLGTDITEHKQAEEHIAYQARLLASVNDAIVGSDAQFRLNAWNASAEAIYGWKAEEVLGRNGLEILHTEWPQVDAEVMRHKIAETGRWRGEATQLRKDGTRIPVEVSSMVLHDENGQITGYVSVNRDIAERKQTEEVLKERASELEELNRELARSNEDLEQFAYVASHDLQEPLRIMSNFSQLLQRRYKDRLDQDADEFIGFIVDAAARMQKLITDLLAYSRAGHGDTDIVEVDCNKVMRRLMDGMASMIESADGQVTFDQLPVITARETSLTQLFQNLIGNALKFHSEQPPRIHISARQEDDEWVFSVTDNGIGLEPQYNQRIFMIFQRLHTRDKYPGTGIGLSICKKIVENLGGRIWVDSEPGKGSTFTFTVPIKKNNG